MHLVAHLHFSNRTKPNKKCKRATSKRTMTDQMNGQQTYRQEGRTAIIKPNIQKPTPNLTN